MRAAGYEISTAVLTRFRLDGGAMFGSVPKLLWERCHAADEKNRIGLCARVLVLRSEGRCILVDAGTGDKLRPREREMYAVQQTSEDALPFQWEEVTDLLLTHLHFDHAGGATVRVAAPQEAAEEFALRAPRARTWLQRRNWDRARSPGPRERASYLAENVLPLEKGWLELVEGEREIVPGITVHPSEGHTAGLQWVKVGDGKSAVVFLADLIPTAAHLHLPFVMGYDMCVETLIREKAELLLRAVDEDWVLIFAHDVDVAAGRVARDAGGRFCLRESVNV